eukprot:1018600-Pyramimonas_sp.AAC.1
MPHDEERGIRVLGFCLRHVGVQIIDLQVYASPGRLELLAESERTSCVSSPKRVATYKELEFVDVSSLVIVELGLAEREGIVRVHGNTTAGQLVEHCVPKDTSKTYKYLCTSGRLDFMGRV